MKNLTVLQLSSWIHEISRSCKKEAPGKVIDGQHTWLCKDCYHLAKNVLFFIGREFNKGFVENIDLDKL